MPQAITKMKCKDKQFTFLAPKIGPTDTRGYCIAGLTRSLKKIPIHLISNSIMS
jgi:hypothetical protein